jgi:hypothetical protein
LSFDKNKELFNMALRCGYCDGGQTKKAIGYGGICSDEAINNNIETEKRAACGDENSFCRQYRDGKIKREDIESVFENGGFVCHESRTLKDWKAFAGIARSGANKGKPIDVSKAARNGLCVLTTCFPGAREEMRCVFAVYLTDETYNDGERKNGYITANEKYKLCFSKPEAQRLLFWNYYANGKNSAEAKWCMGEYRYIGNTAAAQILKDAANIKKGTEDERLAYELLEYFCKTRNIDENGIPEPEGALRRTHTI